MLKRVFIVFCILVLVGFGRHLSAHSDLVSSEPAPGAQLAESPPGIRLTFSEPVAATSRIVLLTDDFRSIEGLVPQFNPEIPEQVYTPVPDLEPGVYSVQWAAASADGHEISGSFSFSVGLVTPGAVTVEAAPAATAATDSEATSLRGGWWLVAIIALAVGLPLLLLAVRRASRS